MYGIEIVTQDLQGSIVLCQKQEVAILSAWIVGGWRAGRSNGVSSVHTKQKTVVDLPTKQ